MADAIRGTIRDSIGRPIAGALVKVLNAATDTLASIFLDEALTTPITNDGVTSPLTEADGSYGPFYVGNQKIDLDIQKAGYTFDVTDQGGIIAYDEGSVRATSANDTLTLKDRILVVDATGGARTISIGALAGFDVGRSFTVIKKDSTANAVIIDPNASETINGQLTLELNMRGQGITFRKISSTEWFADAYGDVWITPAFNAGDYTASGTMTWTVIAGNVVMNEYIIRGKLMIWNILVQASTIGGTPSNQLRVAIPAGKIAAKTGWSVPVVANNGVQVPSPVTTMSAGVQYVVFSKDYVGNNYVAGVTNNTVAGSFVFEIQ